MGEDAPYEIIDGELVEVSPASAEPAEVAIEFAGSIREFVRPRRLGRITGADGGFILRRDPDTVVAPDVGFIRRERIPRGFDRQSYYPVPPDLAVEVISPSNTMAGISRKITKYLAAGVPLVWVAHPRRRTVTVYRPGRPPLDLGMADELDGEDVLPGFRLKIADVFRDPLAE